MRQPPRRPQEPSNVSNSLAPGSLPTLGPSRAKNRSFLYWKRRDHLSPLRGCIKPPATGSCLLPTARTGGKATLSGEPQEAPSLAWSVEKGVSSHPHPGSSCLGPPCLHSQKCGEVSGSRCCGDFGPGHQWALNLLGLGSLICQMGCKQALQGRGRMATHGMCLCPALRKRALCPHLV